MTEAPGSPQPSAEAVPAPDRAEDDQPSTWQPVLYLKIAVLLFVVAYSIAFVAENTDQIRVDFVFTTAKVRLIWEILLLLGVGVVGGVLLSQLYRHRRRAQLAKKAGETRHSRPHLFRRDKAVREPR